MNAVPQAVALNENKIEMEGGLYVLRPKRRMGHQTRRISATLSYNVDDGLRKFSDHYDVSYSSALDAAVALFLEPRGFLEKAKKRRKRKTR